MRVVADLAVGVVHGWRGAYGNNVLENTLGCFTLLGVYSLVRAMDGRAVLWLPVAALSIVAALFTKGPVGLFPLAAPAIAWLTLGRCGQVDSAGQSSQQNVQQNMERPYSFGRLVVLQTATRCAVVAGVAAILQNADAWQYVREYWQQQVVASLSGRRSRRLEFRPAVYSRLACQRAGRAHGDCGSEHRDQRAGAGSKTLGARAFGRPALFCLLTGLSASLPLAISPKQLSFYTAPSWPFYALALALWCAPAVLSLVDWYYSTEQAARRHLVWRTLAGAVTAAAVVVSIAWAGTAGRDRDAIADAAAIAQHLPPHTTLSVTPGLGPSGALHAYLYRTHYISVSVDICPSLCGYLLYARVPSAETTAGESDLPNAHSAND